MNTPKQPSDALVEVFRKELGIGRQEAEELATAMVPDRQQSREELTTEDTE